MGVFNQPADVVSGGVADQPVAFLVVEDILPGFPQTLVAVHAGAVVLKQGLGHDRDHFASLPGGVLDHVFIRQHLVGHLGHGVKAHVDFSLAAGGDFVVMDFDLDSAFL